MKKNKLPKILIINLLIFLILLIILEVVSYKKFNENMNRYLHIINNVQKKEHNTTRNKSSYTLITKNFDYEYEKSNFRPIYGKNFHKNPIILFGCSYTQGSWLQDYETFGYKLSQLTKRPVYTRAQGGWGPQHMLYQLKREDIYKDIKNPDYIIYTYMDDHVDRMHRYQHTYSLKPYINIRYKFKNGHFEEIKPILLPLWGLYCVKESQIWLEDKKNAPINEVANFQEFLLMMKECKKLAQANYPNVKFVILLYKDDWNKEKYINNKNWKNLEKDGFIILNTQNLTGHIMGSQYRFDDGHPNQKAWDEIVYALTKKLNL